MRDIIGVSISIGGEKQRIIFKAISTQHFYIATKPLHHSQETLEFTEAQGAFSLEVIPNYELESKLLSFGEKVQVLEPEWLRAKMVERIEGMREGYG